MRKETVVSVVSNELYPIYTLSLTCIALQSEIVVVLVNFIIAADSWTS